MNYQNESSSKAKMTYFAVSKSTRQQRSPYKFAENMNKQNGKGEDNSLVEKAWTLV